MSVVQQRLSVAGMQCPGCEQVIEEALSRIHGVHLVRADYARGVVDITFDSGEVGLAQIGEGIVEAGYSWSPPVSTQPRRMFRSAMSVLLGLSGIALILLGGRWVEQIRLPGFDQHLSYGLLFLLGLLTGFHCVGMCGGFVLGYTARDAARGRYSFARSHLAYGLGKTLSYTVIGGLFGLLGSFIAFTPLLRGVVAVTAGVFLLLMGLAMLKVFPALHLGIRMPGWLMRFVQGQLRRHRSPLAIGLLNGLMVACGPLQAMYVMAAGTGSFIEGAKRLFIYGVGTLPILLGFGMMASLVSRRATEKIVRLSAVFVMVIGLVMVNRGLILTGSGYDLTTLSAFARVELAEWIETLRTQNPVEGGSQVIHMTVTKSGYQPDTFVLRQNVPVKWVIDGRELTPCNRHILVPALGLDFELVEGLQTIEFVPTEAGVIPWSCWMGMLPGSFVVQAEKSPVESPPAGGDSSGKR